MSFEVLSVGLGVFMLVAYALTVYSKFGEVERALKDMQLDVARLDSFATHRTGKLSLAIFELEKRLEKLEAPSDPK